MALEQRGVHFDTVECSDRVCVACREREGQ